MKNLSVDQLEDVSRPGATLPAKLQLSFEGIRFIWMLESKVNVSCGVHVPDNNSGVTIGPGYDMRERSPGEIVEDFQGILSTKAAQVLSEAAGLRGRKTMWSTSTYKQKLLYSGPPEQTYGLGNVRASNYFSLCFKTAQQPSTIQDSLSVTGYRLRFYSSALDYCYHHDATFCLSKWQQFEILNRVVKKNYAPIVQRIFHKIPLLQWEFDALVSIAYNPSTKITTLPDLLKQGIKGKGWDAMQADILARSTSDISSKEGILLRRNAEWGLFAKGIYEPAEYKDRLASLDKWQCGTPGAHWHNKNIPLEYLI